MFRLLGLQLILHEGHNVQFLTVWRDVFVCVAAELCCVILGDVSTIISLPSFIESGLTKFMRVRFIRGLL